jgi:AraC-like DNA-binding protein
MSSTREGSSVAPRVTPVRYTPPDAHRFDVEIVTAAELRTRVAMVPARGVERVDFYCMLVVAGGCYTHMIDFETFACSAGSCLAVRPGQVHRFGDEQDWDGWLLIVRSELLQPQPSSRSAGGSDGGSGRQPEALPSHVLASDATRDALVELCERMASDASHGGDVRIVNSLLCSQFQVLVGRLQLEHLAAGAGAAASVDARAVERHQEFRRAIERDFRQWRTVAPYARQLGCSVKTLNRATLEIADVSAKTMVVARVVLEAKRLLAHTTAPVSAIADQLGFDEATNFVKFFRREAGMTPGSFRARARAG